MLYDKRWDSKIDQGGPVLLAAADYIRKHGWCQKDFKKEEGPVCTLGAITQVANSREAQHNAYERLKGYLGISCVSTWNDKPERTKEHVIEALVGAAYLGG